MTPSFGGPPVIVTAADAGYLPYLACLLASLGDHPPAGRPCETLIIHRGINESDRRKLGGLTGGPVTWAELNPELLCRLGAPLALANATPHYFRLLAPYLLAEQSRAVYLDADTMLRGDLTPLWTCDLHGRLLAAVRDYLPCIRNAVTNWEELGLNPDAAYFNSGVMVIDLDRWRAEDLPGRVLETCQVNKNYLRSQGRWPQFDQYGLNVIAHSDWQELDRTWNYGTDLPYIESQVIHFIGNGKIGLSTCRPEFEQLFLCTLRRTPFSDWPITAEMPSAPD